MGLDLPTAVRLYLTKVAKTRRIPFPLEAEASRDHPHELQEKPDFDQ